MRKLLFLTLLAFVFLAPLVESTTVTYITDSSTDDPCSALGEDDSLFCDRLESLGYEVKTINERHVQEGSSTWQEYSEGSDMIFLGSVSLDMVNTTIHQNEFCENVIGFTGNRVLFVTMENTIYREPFIEGCAFFNSIISDFYYDNNTCSQMNFKVDSEGFITEGYEIGDAINFYSQEKDVWISNNPDEVWITVECIPPGGPIGFYPVVGVSGKKIFWGLSNPQSFTNDAWEIFDRTVEYAVGDVYWDFDIMLIPSMVTKGEKMWVFAKVTENGREVNGTVNLTLNKIKKDLEYSNGFWRAKDLYTTEVREHTLVLEGNSEYGFKGTDEIKFKTGTILITLDSEKHFKPNKEYTITSRMFLNSKYYDADLYYKLIDPNNSEILSSGTLECADNICNKKITDMPDIEEIILELTAKNDEEKKYGGLLRILERKIAALTIDKETYYPGDTVSIDFEIEWDASSVEMTLIDANDDEVEISMDKETNKHWTKNYSLGTSIPNGTYVIRIEYVIDDDTYVIEKAFDVLTWESYAYLNQQNFYVFETLKMTVGITNAYTSILETNVTITIYDADENLIRTRKGVITGNDEYSTEYLIPNDYADGLSTVEVVLQDPYGRTDTQELEFSVNQYGVTTLISVTPSTISETTIEGKEIKRMITIENSAEDVDITNLIIDISLDFENIVYIKSKPRTIDAKDKFTTELTLKTKGLSPGTHSGKITFNSQVGSDEISINLKIVEDITSKVDEQLFVLGSLEANITKIEDIVDVSEVLSLIEDARALLDESMGEYQDEQYEMAESKYELALSRIRDITPKITALYAEVPDYSGLVWIGAIITVVILILITIIKYWKQIKKFVRKLLKKEKKKEPEKEVVYFEPKGGEYRTEYY